MMQRKKPMARAGFKRKAALTLSPFSGRAVLKGSTFARKRPKARVGTDKKMLAACRGEHCYLAVPDVCLSTSETVVPCHSNEQQHGKGIGIKAHDKFTVPGCMACHAWLDQGPAHRDTKFSVWREAYRVWEPIRDAKLAV